MVASNKTIQNICYAARAFYRSRISPFAHVRESEPTIDEFALNQELGILGLPLEEYRIDIPAFSLWKERSEHLYPPAYRTGYGAYFEEKCLEHYLSLQFAPIDTQSVVIDVANAGSPFPRIVSALGARVYQNDLLFSEGIRKIGDRMYEVGGNACSLPLPDGFADLMVLHCAFEMFEGDQDSLLIREVSRVLKQGGTMVIAPLYLSNSYQILCDLGASRMRCPYDSEAKIVYLPGFHGIRFARFYSAAALKRRVLDSAEGLKMTVLYCSNAKDLNPDFSVLYLRYMGLFRKL